MQRCCGIKYWAAGIESSFYMVKEYIYDFHNVFIHSIHCLFLRLKFYLLDNKIVSDAHSSSSLVINLSALGPPGCGKTATRRAVSITLAITTASALTRSRDLVWYRGFGYSCYAWAALVISR